MRILVVEDEHRIAASIKKGLEQEKYVVDLAYDGQSGFDLASDDVYDLIILDLMLPILDGFEICRQLRQKNIHTPILILTAKSQIDDKVTGLDCGADDYLTKPFSFEELLARIRALIRRPHTSLNTILQIDDLSLNTITFEVTRGDTPILLSSKEYSLLEYLIRHQGRVISKEEIINHVWSYDADILPNTVEVFIKNLRRKIDNPFPDKKPIITTVRGFGYKLTHV